MNEGEGRALEDRRGSTGCAYRAAATVDGVTYYAATRSGAANKLARDLVAAGVADQPVRVAQEGLRGYLEHPSLHRMATRTYSEGNGPLRETDWVDPAILRAQFRDPSGPEEG